MEVFHVAVFLVCPAKTGSIGIISVEYEISLKGLAETVYLLNESFHFTVSVKLVTEEIQHNESFKFQLRIYHRNVAFVRFKNEIISLNLSPDSAVAEEQGANSRVEVVSLFVDDNFFAVISISKKQVFCNSFILDFLKNH